MRTGMFIDLKKCVGCGACATVCRQSNGMPAGVHFSKVLKYETGRYPHSRLHALPTLCMHCAIAPCLRACPTGATNRKPDGTVTVDSALCIGCRACMQACPYEARQFLWEFKNYWTDEKATPYEEASRKQYDLGTVIKCDFCQKRRAEGRAPACVEVCPTGARVFGDLEDPSSEVALLAAKDDAAQLQAELGTEPSVWYRCLPKK